MLSHIKAQEAISDGLFNLEITPVEVILRGNCVTLRADEIGLKFNEPKLRGLKPAFSPEGTVTAGNASRISDGAATLLVASHAKWDELKLKPVARIVGAATFSREPE